MIVTDNASRDGTAEAVARLHPEVTLLTPGRNLGAVGRNLAAGHVRTPAWLPGPALGSFLAAATVLRTDAFREAGGGSGRLWLGGEEELLATDLATRGWWLAYVSEPTVHHAPSVLRDATLRRVHGLRNTLRFCRLRRPCRARAAQDAVPGAYRPARPGFPAAGRMIRLLW